jgi:GH25 family lysozyme M1 (1,4-beta-N-acetylmuramidase)
VEGAEMNLSREAFFILCLVVIGICYGAVLWFEYKDWQKSRRKVKPKDLYNGELGYAGKYLRRHRPRTNANVVAHRVTGMPRWIYFSSAIIVQEKRFPDVSFYQGEIDWDKMRTQSDAVIVRAGQNLWVDQQFKQNWSEARRVGMRRGVYWFYDDRIGPGRQAEILVNLIKDDLPEMEVWIDWERTYGGAFAGLSQVAAMMQAIEPALPGVEVGVYTGYYWWIENTNPVKNAPQFLYLKSRPLWLAWYADASAVQIPQPWTRLTHWQFGTPAVGLEYGVATREIDMNYFNGSPQEFDLKYGVSSETPPPGESMAKNKVTITWDGGARERELPRVGIGDAYRNVLADNTVHYSDFDPVPDTSDPTNPDKQWIKLQSGWYIATRYPSSSGLVVRAIVEPLDALPPPPEPEPTTRSFTFKIDGFKEFTGRLEKE